MKKEEKYDKYFILSEEEKENYKIVLESFKSKKQAYEYFGLKGNYKDIEFLTRFAEYINFDLDYYRKLRKKTIYISKCQNCGRDFFHTSKKSKFCCRNCAATFNNVKRGQRSEETKNRISQTLKSKYSKPLKINKEKRIKKNVRPILQKICDWCGKTFETREKNRKFCCTQCSNDSRKEHLWKEWLSNPKKYPNGNYHLNYNFKKRIMEEQNNQCAVCGCKPWHNGKPLVFVFDHIDGNAANNDRKNIRAVCPNCDSQLDTFKSKNKKSARRRFF